MEPAQQQIPAPVTPVQPTERTPASVPPVPLVETETVESEQEVMQPDTYKPEEPDRTYVDRKETDKETETPHSIKERNSSDDQERMSTQQVKHLYFLILLLLCHFWWCGSTQGQSSDHFLMVSFQT